MAITTDTTDVIVQDIMIGTTIHTTDHGLSIATGPFVFTKITNTAGPVFVTTNRVPGSRSSSASKRTPAALQR